MKFTQDDIKKIAGVALAIAIFVAAQYGIVVPAVQEAARPKSDSIGALVDTSKFGASRDGSTFFIKPGGAFLPTPGATVVIPNYAVTAIPTPTGIPTATPLSVSGVITATAVRAGEFSIAGTPVFWATAIPAVATATPPGNVVATSVIADSVTSNTGVYTTSISIAGTPIVAYATPRPNPVVTAILADSITANTGVYTTSVSIAGTPVVPFATPRANPVVTAIIADSVTANTGVYTTSVSIAGTPVVPYATPNISGGLYAVCGSDTITGTKTIAHGLATPSFINATLAEDITYNAESVSASNAAATVTLKVWGVNTLGTPVAASTPVTVTWCAIGTK